MTKRTIHSHQTERAICTVIRHIYHYTSSADVKKLCEKAFNLGKQLNSALIRRAQGYEGYAKYWDVDIMPASVIDIAREKHHYRPREFTEAKYATMRHRRPELHGTPIFDIIQAIIKINTDDEIDRYAHEALWMAERMLNKLKEVNGEEG